MKVMPEAPLRYELVDDVAWLRMDDGKVNALSPEMMRLLSEALDEARREARAVLVVGRPGQLTAGFDLRILMGGIEAARPLVTQGAELFLKLYAHPQPVVTACTGNAVAGGALILACSDLRIGAHGDYRIGMNEAQRGLPLPIFARRIVGDRLDRGQLTAALLFGELVGPERACEVGWLDRLAPEEELPALAAREASRLAQLPARSYAQIKQGLRGPTVDHVRETLAADLDSLASFLQG